MRIAGVTVRSSLFAREYGSLPTGDITGPDRAEAGASADTWYTDIQGGGPDVNPELTGSLKFPVYDEMAATDPTIKSLLQLWALPIRCALWGLSPSAYGRPTDDPIAVGIRDAVAWNFGLDGELGQMDLPWSGQLGVTIVTGLKHGPAIEEIVWDDVKTWYDRDGDPHLIRPIARLAPRPARYVDRVTRERGRVVEVSQIIAGTRPMPAEKLSYIVFDPEDTGRWEGSSMIRPAWAAWRMKKALQIAAGIGWDRFSSGIPVIWHPDNPDAEARAKRIGEQVRSHERAYVNFPATSPSAATGRPGSDWFMDLLNGANTLADPVPLLRYFTEQESEAGLAMFSRLGSSQTGSRAVGEVQVDPFFLGVQSLALLLARERERQVIRRFVEVNFGEENAEKYTPRLTVSRIAARNVEVLARAIAMLAPAGITFTDRGAVDDVREQLGFEKLGDAAEVMGVTREQLTSILQGAGLDPATLAEIVAQLPAEVGLARNRVGAPGRATGEGDGLPIA